MERKSNLHLVVTLLGSGTCVPSLNRSSCSVLIEIGTGKLLIDAGPGTMRRLLETGTTIFDISHIFFSHFHPDHTGELVPFLFSTKYAGIHKRKVPLTLCAGRGFVHFFEQLKATYGRWIVLEPDMLKIYELNNAASDCFTSDQFTVLSLPMRHNDESIGYRIIAPSGSSVVYTGDTDMCDNLVALSQNANLLICESSFPDELKTEGHLTPSQAGKVATDANVQQLMLTHFYPECDGVDIEKECRKTYKGSLILAEDLMKLVI